jgi:Domain of unknown function (DUF4397)
MLRPRPGGRCRLLIALLAACIAVACGGSDDGDGIAQLRVINATADADSIDLAVEGLDDDNDDAGEQRFVAAVARNGKSDYAAIASGSWSLRLKRAGNTSSLAVNAVGAAKDERYTVFAFGREGDYRVYATLDDDDEEVPAQGKAKVRIFNAAPDAGAVDVYLTESTTSIDDALATHTAVGGATFTFYATVTATTYRLRVTGAGDKTDLRLDVEGLVLASGARTTIVFQPGPSGVLVNALVSEFQGGLATLKNGHARVRLVAGASGNAAVTARLGDVSLNVNLRSPSVATYALVPAGTVTASVHVNASVSLSGTVELQPGGDYTLAVYGDAAAPTWRWIADDNRPAALNERARMRLLHMAQGVDGTMTLVKDYVGVANDVAYGNASSYTQVTAATAARVEVVSPLSVTPLYLAEDLALPSRGVFTMFMLGGAATPTGILRRER